MVVYSRGWCGGDGILVVDVCPQAPPLRRRSLQRRNGAREVVQECVQTVVCIGDSWKMVNLVLGSWLEDDGSGFLYRRHRAGVPDLESMVCMGCYPSQIISRAMVLPLES